jgi:L-alanine-DL-glutamate epimerase-like enolase superfamily enzyme
MAASRAKIKSIHAATIQAELPDPVIFGDWIMNTREFVVVRVTLDSGTTGWAFTLTRDGAVAEQIRKTLAEIYRNTSVEDRVKTFYTAQRRSLPSHSAGIGLRALSVVDLAVWDATARDEDISISQLLKGSRPSMPATAIIGYPPGKMGPKEVSDQVTSLYNAGWRRFKAPVGSTQQLTIDRLKAARLAAPDAWIGCDAAWTYHDVESVVALLEKLDEVRLGWFEDIFPPGDAEIVARLSAMTSVPIAMGDEQGGIYYPEALINKKAVDVVRIDLTCMGGITGGRKIVNQCLEADIAFAAHMFAHVHSQVFGAWGFSNVPIEWGVPWTGVDPYADSLQQPTIETGGNMKALDEGPGFGNLVNFEWIHTQAHVDPDGIFQNE